MLKNKLVVWGTNDEAEKVLIALELQAEAGKVMVYVVPESVATDEFTNKLRDEWTNGGEVSFPEGTITIERSLTVADSLLPNDLRVERGSDVILRAQTEWHFTVLSAKLHAAYEQELQEFKEKIASLAQYDKGMFDSLRQFWEKVQAQSRERNLYKEHADRLRDDINKLFDQLKNLRASVKSEFMVASEKIYNEFLASVEDVEKRIAAGNSKFAPIFDDLKQLQSRYRDARVTNEHRNSIWDRIDAAFKAAKEMKFGPSVNEGSASERQDRRLGGMMEVMKRMEDGIRRDEEELNFQRKRVNTTEGQLEAQIRTAKIKMIEERLVAKREKLADMQKTAQQLTRQADTAKEREQRRTEKEATRQKVQQARENARAEIAAGIKSKRSDDNFMEAAGTVLGDVLMDALDSLKAVASVASEKAEEALHGMAGAVNEVTDIVREKVASAKETVSETASDVVEAVSEKAAAAGEKLSEAKEAISEKASDMADAVSEKMAAAGDKLEDVKESVADTASDLAETASEKIEEAGDMLHTAKDAVSEKVADIADSVENKVEAGVEKAETLAENATETVAEAAGDVKDKVEETV